MDVAVGAPACWRLLGAALAVHALAATVADRPREAVTLRSHVGFPTFGLQLAADRDIIASVDVTRGCVDGTGRGCATVIRIGRVHHGRVTETTRFETDEQVMMPDLDVHDGVVAARLPSSDRIAVFEGKERPTFITLDPACVDTLMFFTGVHLSGHTMAVESRDVWCIYERRTTSWPRSWKLSTTIPHEPGTSIAMSKDRLFVQDNNGVDMYARHAGTWRRTRIIERKIFESFDAIAVSDRWLVAKVRTYEEEHTLRVYDLDHGAQLAATLPSQLRGDDEFAIRFDISDDLLAATGRFDQYWHVRGGAWRPAGLVDTVGDRSDAIYRNVYIGDLIWIGNPDVEAHRRGGGTIHGILADSAMYR